MNDKQPTQSIRINVISRQNDNLKISIITNTRMTVAKLKRSIEQQYTQLYNTDLLVSVIQDAQGFILSNNSTIGDHLRNNQTVYVRTHKHKIGTDMNLPNNVSDIFMTLRYVCGSVIKKLEMLEIMLNPVDVVPEIIHLGFWYSNAEMVCGLCKLLNKIFSGEGIEMYYRSAHQMQNLLLIKLFNFWFVEVADSFSVFPEVGIELLELMHKLSMHPYYSELLRPNKMMKNIQQMSKDSKLPLQSKKLAQQIIKNISHLHRGNLNTKTHPAYIPTTLHQSSYDNQNVEGILDQLNTNDQDAKSQALQQLAANCQQLISQATTRFDYYWQLTAILTIRKFKDNQHLKMFNTVMKAIISHTTREKSNQVMSKDIIKRIHNFLLETPADAHAVVYQYFGVVAKEASGKGCFNVQQGCQYLVSPYLQFQKINILALSQMSQKQKRIESIRFLPNIKDFIRLSLKTQNSLLSLNLLKILSNLTLEEQCRYQIINLKGLQIFVKFLQIAQQSNQPELQRICAKALLNLAISSREIKVKVLGLMSEVFQKYYKGAFDGIASSYIENILKASKI